MVRKLNFSKKNLRFECYNKDYHDIDLSERELAIKQYHVMSNSSNITVRHQMMVQWLSQFERNYIEREILWTENLDNLDSILVIGTTNFSKYDHYQEKSKVYTEN